MLPITQAHRRGQDVTRSIQREPPIHQPPTTSCCQLTNHQQDVPLSYQDDQLMMISHQANDAAPMDDHVPLINQ